MAEQTKKPGRPAGAKSKKKKPTKKEMERMAAQKRIRDEIWSIAMIALGAFLLVAFMGKAGGLGLAISSLTTGLFGMIAYLMPFALVIYGVMLFLNKNAYIETKTVVCLTFILVMMAVFTSNWHITAEDSFTFEFFRGAYTLGAKGSGVVGMFLGLVLIKLIGIYGLYILSIAGIVVCVMVLMNTPLAHVADKAIERREERRAQREEEAEILAGLSELEEEERAVVRERLEEEQRILEEAEPIDVPSFLRKDALPAGGKPRISLGRKEESLSPAQLKIMDYMKDEELFEKGEAFQGYGLADGEPLPEGFGLQGSAVPEAETAASDFDTLDELAAMPEIMEYDPVPVFTEPEPIPVPEPVAAPQPIAKAPSVQPVKQEKPAAAPVEDLKISIEGKTYHTYKMPSLEFLNKVTAGKNIGEQAALQAKAIKLEETMKNFGVNAKVIQVTKGPAVTRYEIQPNTGVKVSSIVRLADDIALNLEAKSIRMEAPIPGKAAVGIEVENDRVNMISIREIVESAEFKSAKSKITFAVGKDIAGNAIVADLKSMPHMLIAGSTGSGKSVCINSLIISILYKAKPDEVKFILIDPKVVELNNYNGIPHLLIPVVTEPSKAAAALNWAVAEMTDRYKKFAEAGVRDLASYNEKMKETQDGGAPALPQIVIIIDELADLMMAAPSQVEEAICRLAQMARAAGMHLIVATQRPSVDIITGVIKANIPSRIAFAVSSQIDSRTILDMGGAEKLVGKGDMLFNPLGVAKPTRVQGCFISDSEVHKVIEFLKEQSPETDYNPDVMHSIDKVQTTDTKEEDGDELLADAIETVVRAEQASASMLQRRFRVGYNRAARLIDMMEARGIIGPQDGSRPRKVLITLDELLALDAKTDEAPAAAPEQMETPAAGDVQ